MSDRGRYLSIKTTPFPATDQTKPSLSKCLARSHPSLDSDSRAQSQLDPPLDPGSRVQSQSDPPFDPGSGARAQSDPPVGPGLPGPKPIGPGLGPGLWSPRPNRTRRSSPLKSDSGLDPGSVRFLASRFRLCALSTPVAQGAAQIAVQTKSLPSLSSTPIYLECF
jgi:hypothetical protein